MLETYNHKYIGKNLQFILVDKQGVIQKSDQTIFIIPIGKSITEINPFFESLAPILSSIEQEYVFNCIYLDIGNEELIVDVSMLKNTEGTLITIHNLTQHYTEYQAVAQSRNESIINTELIVLKNAELEERERFKNTFIQNFSHELRNPLTGIISITNILGDTTLTREQKEMVSFLKESNNHLKMMLEDILSLNMMASNQLVIRKKPFNLFQLLDLLEFTYKAKAKNKDLKFNLNYNKKIPEYIEGDRLRLFQVLANLLENAIKYTEYGSISLDVKLNQKRANTVSLHFKISDTGLGIAKENLTSIFESFSQLDNSGKNSGVGLGLSIVKGLLERMDSKITVVSNIEKGSEFSFSIAFKYPLIHKPEEALQTKDKKLEQLIKLKGTRKFKLLLVEDDTRIQTIFFKFLISTGHFYVDLISDGAKVLDELLNNTYDLILMDVNLPNISGDQITRIIRDLPAGEIKNIPIIGITANAFEKSTRNYLTSGMNAVLTKPFEEEAFLKKIFKHLKS